MKFQKYIIQDSVTIKSALVALNSLSDDNLTLFVVDRNERMVGTLTDGDIRRQLINGISLDSSVAIAMHKDFFYIEENKIDVNQIQYYRSVGITLVPCLNTDKSIVNVYDLKKRKSILPIDAVLMAGGKGERLRPLTEKCPKPLLKVGEKAIIDHNVDRLIQYGVEHVSVTVNYLHEQIERHFQEKSGDVRVNCVCEPQYLGTIGSVKFVDTFFNDDILVMNSDLFTNLDYEDFYLHYKKHDADMSVAAVPYSVSIPYGIFEIEDRAIQGIKEKPIYNYYANAGIYLIKKKILDIIPDGFFYNATDLIEALVAQKKKVIRFPITGYWIDIGKHEDYKKAQELVKYL